MVLVVFPVTFVPVAIYVFLQSDSGFEVGLPIPFIDYAVPIG